MVVKETFSRAPLLYNISMIMCNVHFFSESKVQLRCKVHDFYIEEKQINNNNNNNNRFSKLPITFRGRKLF